MSIGFDRAQESFLEYLRSQSKALNTIKNYRCDLAELKNFCSTANIDFLSLGVAELESYISFLRKRGLRTNSCRRKLMTARKFIRFLSGKVDVATVGIEKCIPPDKIERPPKLVDRAVLDIIIAEQPDTDIGVRNRALIRVLLDTGMLVTEALALRVVDFHGFTLKITGKRARIVTISQATAHDLSLLKQRLNGRSSFFYGYSKAGPNAARMTARGVELLFKAWGKQYEQKQLRPRVLRHMYILNELLKGRAEQEIMGIVGFKTPYAFRVYRQMLQGQIQESNHIKARKRSEETDESVSIGRK